MLDEWLYLVIFLAISMFIPAAAIGAAALLSPKKPAPIKNSIYECGIETVGPSRIQFKAQYYLYGLLFLIFDVETVLLYPFAVAYNRLALFAVVEAVVFVIILAAALVYAWRKGALEWA
ncbi:MAG TPA: NADH-quinone oxidoreductase subunit A [Anaerolineaceae bacterium]|nr:NADH-quinone oxidoreductase subunit A [Anaerolineaceae bacterium]